MKLKRESGAKSFGGLSSMEFFLMELLKLFKSFKKGSGLCCPKIILDDKEWKLGNHLRC